MTDDAPHLDRIHVRDLALRCILGINDDERREKQDVTVNITLHAKLREACRSDRIEDTVDYKKIKKRVLRMAESSSFFLVERLAQAIADICMEAPLVARVDVRVAKPGALRFARAVDIEITRVRSEGM